MKIEVGEWIRSKDGFIGKVQKINYDNMEKSNYYICEKDNVMASNYLENIAKHSKQLIDLIEVGDIVEIRTGLYSSFKYFVENEDNLLLLEEKVKQFWNIQTILTKESYMANCYKVGGEEDEV